MEKYKICEKFESLDSNNNKLQIMLSEKSDNSISIHLDLTDKNNYSMTMFFHPVMYPMLDKTPQLSFIDFEKIEQKELNKLKKLNNVLSEIIKNY